MSTIFPKIPVLSLVTQSLVTHNECTLNFCGKIEDNGLFGGKIKGQNTLFLASLWIFMLWSHVILSEKVHFSKVF